ncbi:hypothetical protein Mal15_59610 [Stieleria maiorica]|uniref:Secreted protein n=1 Tax=Stieleria maiorica TaxID=2795974 RepID=A0A5B9MNG3_9BACT|nr:hypothetical protein [Stieleria maiorica]QEG01880.1 hypothetical protein Mal15_59610 [Stieleria maiorica]
MKSRFSWPVVCAALLALPSAGCGDPQPSNVMENVDEQAFADYERMISEDANVQNDAEPDQQRPE